MSGGSWEYVCYKVQDAADRLCHSKCPHRKAFGVHLKLIAEALHDIEWVDSCDKGPGDEIAAILKCVTHAEVLSEMIQDAKKVRDDLNELIEVYEEGK